MEQAFEDKCFIDIKAALFTQGLDMTQSMSTMTGEASKERSTIVSVTLMSSADQQHHVNNSGLVEVNSYCHTIRPISSSTTSAERATMYQAARLGNIVATMPHGEGDCIRSENPSKVHPLVDSLEKSIRCTDRSEECHIAHRGGASVLYPQRLSSDVLQIWQGPHGHGHNA